VGIGHVMQSTKPALTQRKGLKKQAMQPEIGKQVFYYIFTIFTVFRLVVNYQ